MFPLIKEILAMESDSREITLRGWVRTKRDMKNLVFVEVNDGSAIGSIQCTFDLASLGWAAVSASPAAAASLAGPAVLTGSAALAHLATGASVEISGKLIPSPAQGQAVELAAESLTLLGEAPAEDLPAAGKRPAIKAYPLQKKRHTLEFLREMPQLRARTNTLGAVMRVRSRLGFAIHQFFQERGYLYFNSPIITGSDAEGAGAMFRVTTLDKAGISAGKPDFFGRETFLSVSGQLEAETYATALSRVYTFAPTFRAENSNTARHLAEFWMIEPETAFFTLEDNMTLAEDFLKYLFTTVLGDCADDLRFFDERIEKGIIATLESVAASTFTHMTYTDAVKELEKAAAAGKGGEDGKPFDFKPYWGCDLQSEHEKYLTEQAARGPVIVTDYPKDIKAFYMKLNNDGKTVRAMDVLVPRLGEIIGGSERENNLEALAFRMADLGMNPESYDWYLDLRRYGTVPHSGFGLGFERLVQYVTGMANIRDVIPYPRAAGQVY